MVDENRQSKSRRPAFAVLGVGVLLLLVLLLVRLNVPRPESKPTSSPAPSNEVPAAPLTAHAKQGEQPVTPQGIEPASPKRIARPGKILGSIVLPEKREAYTYRIYVFSQEGKLERYNMFSCESQFEVANLSPGMKAVVLYSIEGDFTSTHQITTVPEGGESHVVLLPGIPSLLKGTVVNSQGQPLEGVIVATTEQLTLPDALFPNGKPKRSQSISHYSGSSQFSDRSPTVKKNAKGFSDIDPIGGKVSRGVATDSKGEFSLPLSSAQTVVHLRVFRDLGSNLAEGDFLPSQAPIRIVVTRE